jgi:hypothetical protein
MDAPVPHRQSMEFLPDDFLPEDEPVLQSAEFQPEGELACVYGPVHALCLAWAATDVQTCRGYVKACTFTADELLMRTPPLAPAPHAETPESFHLPEHLSDQPVPRDGDKKTAPRRKKVKADKANETVVVKDTFLEWLRVCPSAMGCPLNGRGVTHRPVSCPTQRTHATQHECHECPKKSDKFGISAKKRLTAVSAERFAGHEEHRARAAARCPRPAAEAEAGHARRCATDAAAGAASAGGTEGHVDKHLDASQAQAQPRRPKEVSPNTFSRGAAKSPWSCIHPHGLVGFTTNKTRDWRLVSHRGGTDMPPPPMHALPQRTDQSPEQSDVQEDMFPQYEEMPLPDDDQGATPARPRLLVENNSALKTSHADDERVREGTQRWAGTSQAVPPTAA